MRYNYLVYQLKPVYTYTESTSSNTDYTGEDLTKIVTAYNDVRLDTEKGGYIGVGVPSTMTLLDISISGSTNWWIPERRENNGWYYDTFRQYDTLSSSYAHSIVLVLDRKITGHIKGNYIMSIKAEDGSYPNDGKYGDYWYIKSTEVNDPPEAPSVIAPNGGEIITAPFLVSWTKPPDVNNDTLTYDVDLSTDNGKKWNRIASDLINTQLFYDFSGKSDTSTGKIRVRASDGELAGEWGVSENVFTINYNYPPNPPYELEPSGGKVVDQEKTIRFMWIHSDPNSSDPQSKFDLRWRLKGEQIWSYLSEITVRNYQDIPANTLPLGEIEWQVRTYDQAGLVSQWSGIEVFISGSKPETAIWTYPKHGEKVIDAKPTFQWSSNVQTAFRVILYDDNDFIIWDTGDVEGSNKAITSWIALEDNSFFSVSVLIRNAENFWSEEEKITFNTSYSSPPKPILNIYGSNATITLEIINPESEGLQPQVVSNNIYKLIDNEWVRIATKIPPNGAFIDHTARSKVKEQYRVMAVAGNEGIHYSDIYQHSIAFMGVYIHNTQDPFMTVKHFKFDGGGRSENLGKEYALMNFKGRKAPVAEFAESENRSVSTTLKLLTNEELFALEKLARSYQTLCYRDGRGRLLFGFIPSLSISDAVYGYEVNLDFIGIDYKGSV